MSQHGDRNVTFNLNLFVKLCSSSNIASDHWQADPIQYLGPFRQVFREVAIDADHDFEYDWVFVYTYIQVCIYDLHLNFKNCIFHSFEWCTSEKSLIFRMNHYFPPAYTFWILSNNESDIFTISSVFVYDYTTNRFYNLWPNTIH